MGRRSPTGGTVLAGVGRQTAAALVFARLLAAFACLYMYALLCVGSAVPAAAETLGERFGVKHNQPGQEPEKMFVEADQLVYDQNKNTVSAVGNARVYYEGKVLEADHVTYDRNTGRVFAEGRAKLTLKNGTILHGGRFDLTKDLRDGFIESLNANTADRTYFSAPRAEISGGDTTVYQKGTYTACVACAENPTKPPLWRVRAKRIIHKNDEQMVYYEDAWLEFLGIPVAYVPVFSAPDPSVTRKSGILTPYTLDNSQLGWGAAVPIFWALAPNYDVTFTPTYFVQQGFFADVQWRQRLESGSYFIRANGIFEEHPNDFFPQPYGAGGQQFRGSLASEGTFKIDNYWKYGWSFTLLSDKWYVNDYGMYNQTISTNYYSEVTSTAYLTGQGDRSYFDLRGYHFEGLSSHDFAPQQPNVIPQVDYNRSFDVDPAKTSGIGGVVNLDFNFTSMSAEAASYQAVGMRQLDNAFNLYDVCSSYTPGKCLLRGIGGDYSRATAEVSWQRKYVDPIGEVWTPFAFARLNGQWLDLNTTDTFTFGSPLGSSTLSNASQANFLGQTNGIDAYAIPAVGMEYRYPILVATSLGSVVFEPIGQIVARPNRILGTASLVNMDAQSLVFDDTNLFAWDKNSGYDQFETGTRANYGGQVTWNFKNGGYVNVLAGQSYQLAGPNGYATPDAANLGLSSGLDTRASDYIGAFTFAPGPVVSFSAKGRFDQTTLDPRRIDLTTNINLGALTGSINFADYTAQPILGYDVRREGLGLGARYQLNGNYYVSGNVVFDMSRQYYPPSIIGNNNPGTFPIAALGGGIGYKDDCTTFSVNYTSVYQDNGAGTFIHNNTVLVELQLRTLGDFKFKQTTIGNTAQQSLDGIK